MKRRLVLCAIILILFTMAHQWSSSASSGTSSISYLNPDGSGAREYVRFQDVFAGMTTYYAFWIDGTRWILTGEGAISCDAPEASMAWALLIEERRGEIVQACSWRWTKWAKAHALDELDSGSFGHYKHYLSLLRVDCENLHGKIWNSVPDERKELITGWCNAPERIWSR